MRTRKSALTAIVVGAVLLLSACDVGSSVTDALAGEITLLSGTAESNNAPPATGDFVTPEGGPPPRGEQSIAAKRWAGLKTGTADGIDPVVTNGSGLTLYRFDRDSANPPTSNCSGDCAETWPKVLVGEGSRLFAGESIDRSRVGSIPAGDGQFQVTLGGWPLYRFARDTRPGRANGQGVQGTWFAVAPDGQKAVGGDGDAGGGTGGPGSGSGGDSDVNGGDSDGAGNGGGAGDGGGNSARSVTLFDNPGREGSDAAQGIANSGADNAGCVDVPRPGRGSSITASGSYTLYTGADCTGRSQRLEGNQDDLGGFDDAVRSIRLAPRG